MNRDRLLEVKKRHQQLLMKLENVVSVGIGYKQIGGTYTKDLCLVVGVTKKLPATELRRTDLIPPLVEDCRTDVMELGKIEALERPGKFRPAPGGVSTGHVDITAGTLGCLVRRNDETFILSNNHVLANSNAGSIGDPILQPGAYDGGTAPDDVIGTLEDFVTINFGGGSDGSLWGFLKMLLCMLFGIFCEEGETNYVDAALARPQSPDLVSPEILGIGVPAGWTSAALGDAIQKSGRTTELTQDEVLQTDVMVQVQYGGGKIATFDEQLIAGPMSAGGDSGSAVLNMQNQVVGLLFAGSEQTTVINPINRVVEALQIAI